MGIVLAMQIVILFLRNSDDFVTLLSVPGKRIAWCGAALRRLWVLGP